MFTVGKNVSNLLWTVHNSIPLLSRRSPSLSFLVFIFSYLAASGLKAVRKMSDLGCSMQTLRIWFPELGSKLGPLHWECLSAAKQALNVYISHPDLSWFDLDLGRAGPSSRTQIMELSMSRETGLRIKNPRKRQRHCEGPPRRQNPGRRPSEGKQNRFEREGRRFNE